MHRGSRKGKEGINPEFRARSKQQALAGTLGLQALEFFDAWATKNICSHTTSASTARFNAALVTSVDGEKYIFFASTKLKRTAFSEVLHAPWSIFKGRKPS
jgi:hypothetical protein